MEEDVDFVETSDAEELEEIQGLFYKGPQGRRAREEPKTKSADSDDDDDDEKETKKRKISSLGQSSSPETEFSEPALFEYTVESRANTPLSFPESDSESQDPMDLFKSPERFPSPLPAAASSPFSALSPSPPAAPSPPAIPPSPPPADPPSPPPPVPEANADEALALALHNAPRRNLRERRPEQQRPYTYDRLMYQKQLGHVPEAIIRQPQIDREQRDARRRAEQEESQYVPQEEESQYVPLDEEEQQPRQQEIDRLMPSPLQSSDDDDDMRRLSKDARKALKEKKRKEREQKRAQKAQKIKAFPIQNAMPGPSNHPNRYTPSPPPQPRSHFIPSPFHSPSLPHAPTPLRISRSPSVSPVPAHSPTRSSTNQPRSPQAASESESSSSDSDSWQARKRRKQLKALRRMLPRFMHLDYRKDQPARAKEKGKEKQRSSPSNEHTGSEAEIDLSDDDQDNLRPGQARVRLRKGRPVGEIKGDTESEDEVEFVEYPSELNHFDDPVPGPSDRRASAPASPARSPSVGFSGFRFRAAGSPSFRRSKAKQPADSSSSSSSSDSGLGSDWEASEVDDEDIAHFLDSSDGDRDDVLIDYMLARNVSFGQGVSTSRKRKRRTGTGSGSRRPRKRREIGKGLGIGISKGKVEEKEKSKGPYDSDSDILSGSNSNPAKPKYTFNIIRPGQGGGRQTLLPFQKKEKHKGKVKVKTKTKAVQPNRDRNRQTQRSKPSASAGGRDSRPYQQQQHHYYDEEAEDPSDSEDDGDAPDPRPKTKKQTWKQKLKQRKEAERMQGVYTHVADPGTRIMGVGGELREESHLGGDGGTRRRNSGKKTKAKSKSKGKSERSRHSKGKGLSRGTRINNEDEDDDDLRRALAPPPPSSQPALKNKSKALPQRRLKPNVDHEQTQQQEDEPETRSHSHSNLSELEFTLLPPGKSFGFNTYIRRGMLYELGQLLTRQPSAPPSSTPSSTSAPFSSSAPVPPASTPAPTSPISSALPLPTSSPTASPTNAYHPTYGLSLRPAHPPTSFSLLKPLSSFLQDFPVFCVSLGDFICDNDVPSDEEALTTVAGEWRLVMRGIGGVLTGLLDRTEESADTESQSRIQSAVKNSIGALITRMCDSEEQWSIERTKCMTLTMLDACWFAVEMAVRAGFRISGSITSSSSSLLLDAFNLLVRCLLECDPGLREAMTLMRDPDPEKRELSDPNSVGQRVAELWVCLIHVLKPRAKEGVDGVASSTHQAHPLWFIILSELKHRSPESWSLRTNETIWQIISSLCALSQFSEHGLCKDKPTTLSGSSGHWDIINFALSQVRLKADPEAERSTPPLALEKRDRYVSLIVFRCYLLVSRWGWTLDSPSGSADAVLKTLSEIFSSRKYRNLYHEKADFPEFLRTQRWDSCLECHPKRDTAFVLFLKLVVQAGSAIRKLHTETGQVATKATKPRLRRMLTLIIPLGSTSFTKAKPPQGNELSMLYNRMAGTAVGLHLNPSDYRSRINQARAYVDFPNADDTSRIACIRCLMYLSQMMVLDKTVDAECVVRGWYMDIIDVLLKEYKELQTKARNGAEPNAERLLNRVRLLVNAVLGSLRHILNAYNDPDVGVSYPDSSLLDVVQRVGNVDIMENSQTAREVMAVMRTFLLLRDKVVPAPQRPPIEPLLYNGLDSNESQDSQDAYGDMDIDMDDPVLKGLLDGGGAIHSDDASLDSDIQSKDKSAAKTLGQLSWVLYRCVKNAFLNYPRGRKPSTRYMENVDSWIDTWSRCADVAIIHSKMTWFAQCLNIQNPWREGGNIEWRRRIDIRIAFNILTRTPMSYQDTNIRDYFIESMFDALIPENEITVEHDFVAWLLSIDGLRHPLLRNLPVILPPPPEIYALTAEEFSSLREALLVGVLDNIEKSLHDEENKSGNRTVVGENSENKRYGNLLARFLNMLKEMSVSREEGSKERKDYESKCKKIAAIIFDDHPRIGTWGRLSKWDVWRRGLD